jgi:hypothetical protein
MTRKSTVLLIALFCVAAAARCPPLASAQSPATGSKPSAHTLPRPSAPMKVSLRLEGSALLNADALLTVQVTALADAPGTQISLILPPEIAVTSGASSWSADLSPGQTFEAQATLRASTVGHHKVTAQAVCEHPDGYTFGKASSLYVMVREASIQVSDQPLVVAEARTESANAPLAGPPAHAPERVSRKKRPPAVEPDASLATIITVYGYWYYRDRDGFDHPLRDARVEIWDDDIVGDDLLGVVYTDADGRYEATVAHDDVSGGIDAYARILCTDDYAVHVTDFDDDLYSSDTPVRDDLGTGTWDLGAWAIIDPDNRMVWYMYDTIAQLAYDFLLDNVGWENLYDLQVRWSPTNTDVGSWYWLGGGPIELLDVHRWDEDVLLHEYGHFVMDMIYEVFPPHPDCFHHGWGIDTNPGCAWVEGWANFLQGAIQGHDDFVITYEDIIHYSLEGPLPMANEAEDEGAVAAVLWDIFDDHDELWDSMDNGINGASNNGIWHIVADYNPNDIVEFWYGWDESANGYECEVSSILRHHWIEYGPTKPSDEPFLFWPMDYSHTCDPFPAFEWSSVSDATWYHLQVDDHQYFSSPEIDVTITSTIHAASVPLPAGTYRWRVSAGNTCGEGGWSDSWILFVDPPVATPTLLAPPDIACPPPVFEWTPVDVAVSYRLQVDRKDYAGFPPQWVWENVISTTTSSPTYEPDQWLPLEMWGYRWRVQAIGEDCDGPWSSYQSLFLLPPPGVVSEPDPSDGAISVTLNSDLYWLGASNTVSYTVYFGPFFKPAPIMTTTATTLTLPRLDELTHYWWKIRAHNHGCYTDGPIWDFTTGANQAPALGFVEPSSGSGPVGQTQYFQTSWLDADGWEDLKQCYFHIGATPSGVGNVTLLYNAVKDKLWLLSDDGTMWTGGCAPGSGDRLENSQAEVACSQTTVYGDGDTLILGWPVKFKPGFTGTKKLGLKAQDLGRARAKGAWKGTWTIQ